MSKSATDLPSLARRLLMLNPPERFEIVAELLRATDKPEMVRIGWMLAERTVHEHSASEGFRALREASSRHEEPSTT